MPPLTLEQVLARSMRLPRPRTQPHVSRLFRGEAARAAQAAAFLSDAGDGSPSANPPFSLTSSSSSTSPVAGWSPATSQSHTRRLPHVSSSLGSSSRQAQRNFFELMERDEAARQTGRLAIHRSDHLVRNSADLTTYLRAASRTGSWEDGLRGFAEATALPAVAALLSSSTSVHKDDCAAAPNHTISGESGDIFSPAVTLRSAPPSGVNPNAEQITILLNMCAKAEQWNLVESIGAFFAPAFPETFTRAVELLACRPSFLLSSSASSPSSWRAAFHYLTVRCPLPAAEVPVEAYNVCLRGCEEAKDWRGALEVLRAMGPNPLQGWTSSSERDAPLAVEDAKGSGDEEAMESTSASLPAPSATAAPPPNVVSYATLIATLEQAGKDQLASEVLNRLPALEKEEITASYAALILVWSNQVLRKQRRRF